MKTNLLFILIAFICGINCTQLKAEENVNSASLPSTNINVDLKSQSVSSRYLELIYVFVDPVTGDSRIIGSKYYYCNVGETLTVTAPQVIDNTYRYIGWLNSNGIDTTAPQTQSFLMDRDRTEYAYYSL
nr:hypothetical protein [Parabacteroides goldsteinii]